MSLNKIDPTKTKAWKLLEDHFSEIKSDEIKTLLIKGALTIIILLGMIFLLIFQKTELMIEL